MPPWPSKVQQMRRVARVAIHDPRTPADFRTSVIGMRSAQNYHVRITPTVTKVSDGNFIQKIVKLAPFWNKIKIYNDLLILCQKRANFFIHICRSEENEPFEKKM